MRRKKLLAAALVSFPLAALPIALVAVAAPLVARAADAAASRFDPERMEKRMRLARTLGLAEALDLDAPQALKLGESIARFDERRLAVHRQMRDARDVLRRAAKGEKVAAADVDAAIQKALDARAQMQAVDREMVSTVTKDLAPDKKARAVLFLARFQRRFGGPGMHGPGGHWGPGGGMGGPGMRGRGGPGGPGGGPGTTGMGPGGMGPGMMGMAPPPPPDGDGFSDWDDED